MQESSIPISMNILTYFTFKKAKLLQQSFTNTVNCRIERFTLNTGSMAPMNFFIGAGFLNTLAELQENAEIFASCRL